MWRQRQIPLSLIWLCGITSVLTLLSGIPAANSHLQRLAEQNLIVSPVEILSLHRRNRIENQQLSFQRKKEKEGNIPIVRSKICTANKAAKQEGAGWGGVGVGWGAVGWITYEHDHYRLLANKAHIDPVSCRCVSGQRRREREQRGLQCMLGDWVKPQALYD